MNDNLKMSVTYPTIEGECYFLIHTKDYNCLYSIAITYEQYEQLHYGIGLPHYTM